MLRKILLLIAVLALVVVVFDRVNKNKSKRFEVLLDKEMTICTKK